MLSILKDISYNQLNSILEITGPYIQYTVEHKNSYSNEITDDQIQYANILHANDYLTANEAPAHCI